MIDITQFRYAKFKPSIRTTRCKNCFNMPGMDYSKIKPGNPRIVVSTGDWMPSDRHVTLCPRCAEEQATRLEALARKIREAIGQ